jgi:superfamily II DNA or RNA helicase
MCVTLTMGANVGAARLPSSLYWAARQELTLTNPAFAKKERYGFWTGDIDETVTLIERRGDETILPRGYLPRLVELLKASGEPYTIHDRRLVLPHVPLEFSGTLRGYQAKAIGSATLHSNGVVIAPCGSGKTVMGCALMAHWRQPATVLCHTKELLTQWRDSIRRFLGVEPGIIGAGDATFSDTVNVALVQALTAKPDILQELTRRTGLVMLDECHHCPAETFTTVMQAFPAAIRYGLSATPTRADGLTSFVTSVIGPYRAIITHGELEAAGVRVVPDIRFVRTGASVWNVVEDWSGVMRGLAENGARNRLICELARDAVNEGRTVLLLAGLVDHVEYLGGELGSVARVLHGRMAKKARERALSDIREGKASILIGTQVADEGLDLPTLDTLILASPSRSPGRTEQRVGRILRNLEGKRQAVVYDLVDDHPVLFGQARSRFFDAYRELCPGMRLPAWLERKKR